MKQGIVPELANRLRQTCRNCSHVNMGVYTFTHKGAAVVGWHIQVGYEIMWRCMQRLLMHVGVKCGDDIDLHWERHIEYMSGYIYIYMGEVFWYTIQNEF